jgi:cytochrome c5
LAQNDNGRVGFTVLLLAALAIVLVIQLSWALFDGGSPALNADEVSARIRPVGEVNTGAPIPPAPAREVARVEPARPAASTPAPQPAESARTGEQVFGSACRTCHGAGVAGAPKLGDRAAWAPRLQKGMDVLVQNAIKGFRGSSGVMPPRGTCGSCSDAEIRSAVEYMVSQSR